MPSRPSSNLSKGNTALAFVVHSSFDQEDADNVYPCPSPDEIADAQRERYLPDELTRDLARRMHYSAYRHSKCKDIRQARLWKQHYFQLRDLIIVGNMKLIYSVVHRHYTHSWHADDMIGECQVVMVRLVSLYNPWKGIRFSTYACTCLIRAVCRRSRQVVSDRLFTSLSIDSLSGVDGAHEVAEEQQFPEPARIFDFLNQDNGLLTPQEKTVISRRFLVMENGKTMTLERLGEKMGLSKERVRQLQVAALNKLKLALQDSLHVFGLI